MGYMCGRFAVTTDPALLAEKIKAIDETIAATEAKGPNFNVAPTTTISSVVKRHAEPDDESTRRVRSMRWGLVPPWVKAKDDGTPETKGPLLINARAETVTTSAAFRASAKSSGVWFRWTAGTSGVRVRRAPAAEGRQDAVLHAWRGRRAVVHGRSLVDVAAGEGRPPLLTCTIITTESAGQLAEIHDRMPLSISERDWDRWLDPDAPMDEGLLRGHGDLTASRSARCPGWSTASATTDPS